MNIFKFLTGNRGRVKWTSVASLAVGAGIFLSTGPLVKEAAQPLPPDRSVFSDEAEARLHDIRDNYVGGEGSFSNNQGIRFGQRTGLSDEEDAPDFSRGVGNSISGGAYSTKRGVGFVNGADNVDEVAPNSPLAEGNYNAADGIRSSGRNSSGRNGGRGAYGNGAAGGRNGTGGNAVNSLSKSSMASAGGGSSVGNNGAYQGGGNRPGGSNANVPPKAEPGLSGAMGSSNDSIGLLAQAPNKASFGSRDGSGTNGGRRTNAAGEQLQRTYRYTKEVARSNNETATGVEDFLADDANNHDTDGSGYDTNDDPPTTTDFETVEVDPGTKAQDWGDREAARQKALAKARKHLAMQMLLMLGVGLGVGTSVYFLANSARKKEEEANQKMIEYQAALLKSSDWLVKAQMATDPILASTYRANAEQERARAFQLRAQSTALKATAKTMKIIAGVAIGGFALYAGAMIAQCIRFMHVWKNEAGMVPLCGMVVASAASVGVGLAYKAGISGGSFSSQTTMELLKTGGQKVGDMANRLVQEVEKNPNGK